MLRLLPAGLLLHWPVAALASSPQLPSATLSHTLSSRVDDVSAGEYVNGSKIANGLEKQAQLLRRQVAEGLSLLGSADERKIAEDQDPPGDKQYDPDTGKVIGPDGTPTNDDNPINPFGQENPALRVPKNPGHGRRRRRTPANNADVGPTAQNNGDGFRPGGVPAPSGKPSYRTHPGDSVSRRAGSQKYDPDTGKEIGPPGGIEDPDYNPFGSENAALRRPHTQQIGRRRRRSPANNADVTGDQQGNGDGFRPGSPHFGAGPPGLPTRTRGFGRPAGGGSSGPIPYPGVGQAPSPGQYGGPYGYGRIPHADRGASQFRPARPPRAARRTMSSGTGQLGSGSQGVPWPMDKTLGTDGRYHYPGDGSGQAIVQRRRRRSSRSEIHHKQKKKKRKVDPRAKKEHAHKWKMEKESKVLRYAQEAEHDSGAPPHPNQYHYYQVSVQPLGRGPLKPVHAHHGHHQEHYYYHGHHGHQQQQHYHHAHHGFGKHGFGKHGFGKHGFGKHKGKHMGKHGFGKHKGKYGHWHGFGKQKGKFKHGHFPSHMPNGGQPIIWNHPRAEKNHDKPSARDHFNHIMGYTHASPQKTVAKPTLPPDGPAIQQEERKEEYYYDYGYDQPEWFGDKKEKPWADPYYMPPVKPSKFRDYGGGAKAMKIRAEAEKYFDKEKAADGDPEKLRWLADGVRKGIEKTTRRVVTGQPARR